MKICYECQESLPEEYFYEDAHSNDGYTSSCKSCQKKRSKEYYQKAKNRLTDKQKQARRDAFKKWKAKQNEKRMANSGGHKDLSESNSESQSGA